MRRAVMNSAAVGGRAPEVSDGARGLALAALDGRHHVARGGVAHDSPRSMRLTAPRSIFGTYLRSASKVSMRSRPGGGEQLRQASADASGA